MEKGYYLGFSMCPFCILAGLEILMSQDTRFEFFYIASNVTQVPMAIEHIARRIPEDLVILFKQEEKHYSSTEHYSAIYRYIWVTYLKVSSQSDNNLRDASLI